MRGLDDHQARKAGVLRIAALAALGRSFERAGSDDARGWQGEGAGANLDGRSLEVFVAIVNAPRCR